MTRVEAGIAGLTAGQQETNERVARLETNMAEMAREVAEMARTQTHSYEVVAVMADTHRHTGEKLDAFIGVLERYISEGRDGRAGGEDAGQLGARLDKKGGSE